MPNHPRLILRGNRYYHRAAIPQDIKGTYPKSEETFSLGTSEYKEALKRVRIAAVDVDKRFEAHRKHLTRQNEPLQSEISDAQIYEIGEVYYAYLLEEDDEVRFRGFSEYEKRTLTIQSDGPAELQNAFKVISEVYGDELVANRETLEQRAETVKWLDEEVRRKYARGVVDDITDSEIEEVMSWDGIELRLDPNSASWKKVGRVIQAATIRAYGVILQRDNGDVIETPVGLPLSIGSKEQQSQLKLLSIAKNEWIAEKSGRNWVGKTENDHRVWMGHFISVIGDKPIDAYDKKDARLFKSLLMKLPPNWQQRNELKGLRIEVAAERAASLSLKPMSDKNINKILGFVGALWGWAASNFDDQLSNPFKGMKIKIRVAARDERDPFTSEELKTIFSSSLFTGCKSSRHWNVVGSCIPKDHGRFWVPLIAIFTGARSGEIIQLRVADIREADGIHYFHMTDAEADQRLKTGASGRDIPVHRDLIEVGLLELVELRKLQGEVRLFPELKMGSDGYYSTPYSRHFRRLLEACGVKKSTKEVFHSFRHNFEDACRDSGVSVEIMNALQGHVDGGMAGRYGRGFLLEKLHEAMREIKYRGFDVSHLVERRE